MDKYNIDAIKYCAVLFSKYLFLEQDKSNCFDQSSDSSLVQNETYVDAESNNVSK